MGGKKKKKKVKKKAVTPASNVASNRSNHTDALLRSHNQQDLKSELNKYQVADTSNAGSHARSPLQFVTNAVNSPVNQAYVQIAEEPGEEANLQSYVDGYDIVAPGPMMQMAELQSNNMLTNSGEYNYSNMHNEGGSMNMVMSAAGSQQQHRQGGGKRGGDMARRS
jgi:hypothetical protein